MIPVSEAARQTPHWQQELARAISDPVELLRALALDPALLPGARRAMSQFPLRVPLPFVARMRRGDAADPLLRQVLPLDAETMDVPGYVADPLREAAGVDGVLQKYDGRALVITTGACAVHCRYCFRRHFPYGDARAARDGWRAVLERIRRDTTLDEAILSGGDPLSLADARLAQLVDGLGSIPHLERLRIHTRVPVVLPSRVDDALLGWMTATRLKVVVVLHVNHANEIDDEVAGALQALHDTGATLFNQSVLLRGVNDTEDALCALSERLFTAGVTPYYLHLLDPVSGAAHFDVPETEARRLIRGVQARLPGYLVPRLARETPGDASKTLLAPGT